MSVAEIQRSVSNLTEKQRAELALWILDSLPHASGEDATKESLEEADRRRRELDSGRACLIPENEFWNAIEKERQRWR